MKITAELKKINKDIKDLQGTISQTSKDARELGRDMKLDPTNVELIVKKWDTLGKELQQSEALLEQYTAKEQELNKLMEENKGKPKVYADYGDQLRKTVADAEALKNKIADLNKQIQSNAKESEIAKAKILQLKDPYDKLSKATRTAARTVALVTGALTLFVKKSLDAAKNVYSLSKSFGISAENLQVYGRALEFATGQSDLYTQSLKAMSTGLAQAAAGRGVAYSQALRNIGLSAQQLATLSREDAYQIIFQQLQQVANETERASAAQVLFGESGLYIAQVAGQGAEAWAEYLDQAERYGVITSEQAEKANKLNVEFSIMKSQMEMAGTELAVSFSPLVEAATPIITALANVIAYLSNGLKNMGVVGQGLIVVFFLMVTLLPKVVSWWYQYSVAQITAGNSADKASRDFQKLGKSANKVLLVIGLVSLAIIALAALFGAFKKESKETADSVANDWGKTSDALKNAGFDANTSVEHYAYENNERVVNITVDISGKGETAISDAAASTVALLTVDEIQKRLGELTK